MKYLHLSLHFIISIYHFERNKVITLERNSPYQPNRLYQQNPQFLKMVAREAEGRTLWRRSRPYAFMRWTCTYLYSIYIELIYILYTIFYSFHYVIVMFFSLWRVSYHIQMCIYFSPKVK